MMFSGIVQEVGRVSQAKKDALTVTADTVPARLSVSQSVAVNGVCLTVVKVAKAGFDVELVTETLQRTNLGDLCVGDTVNLETALNYGEPVGGHFVSGHVEGVGQIEALEPQSNSVVMRIGIPHNIIKNVVGKGYIAVDGTSLTVADMGESWFEVALIPHTQKTTIANTYRVGTHVNLESDMQVKYALRGH